MVYRERREKIAGFEVITEVIGQIFNINTEKVFSSLRNKYEIEIFQETYDSDLLRAKVEALREAVSSIKKTKKEQQAYARKLEKLGQVYEKNDNKKK